MALLSNVELIFWNLGEKSDPPLVNTVRDALVQRGLDPERAADIPDTTAFRRAVESRKDKGIVSRCWKRKADEVLCAQLDQEGEENGELRRSRLAVWELTEDYGPRLFSGHDDEEAFRLAYEAARKRYTWAEVSKVIQEVLSKDGLGAYSPRRGGGVYFAPVSPGALDLLNRLEQFASQLGVRFLRYQIPDTMAQRDEIGDAIAASLTADLDSHASAIAGYHADTKQGHITNRREAIAATETMVGRLAHLLNGHTVLLRARITKLREDLDRAEAVIADAKRAAEEAAAQAAPSRRIIGITPETTNPEVNANAG